MRQCLVVWTDMQPAAIQNALTQLRKDARLKAVIARYPTPDDLGVRTDVYVALTRAIIYQQLSGKAAATIYGRYAALFTGGTPDCNAFFKKKPETLRAAGLSGQKLRYLTDLSEKFQAGFIRPEKFPSMSDQEIREHLVAIKGIGVWTADMFLMFTLGRPDVLPTLDLGIKKGFQKLYNLRQLPDAEKMEKLAKHWAPYRTVASWYLWRLADEGNANRPAK